jgi:transposase InsO family protein
MTDNALAYRHSHAFAQAVADLGAVQRFTKPYQPQINGKVEGFIRTLLHEWAYQRPHASNHERTAALPAWLQTYNRRVESRAGAVVCSHRLQGPRRGSLALQLSPWLTA